MRLNLPGISNKGQRSMAVRQTNGQISFSDVYLTLATFFQGAPTILHYNLSSYLEKNNFLSASSASCFYSYVTYISVIPTVFSDWSYWPFGLYHRKTPWWPWLWHCYWLQSAVWNPYGLWRPSCWFLCLQAKILEANSWQSGWYNEVRYL